MAQNARDGRSARARLDGRGGAYGLPTARVSFTFVAHPRVMPGNACSGGRSRSVSPSLRWRRSAAARALMAEIRAPGRRCRDFGAGCTRTTAVGSTSWASSRAHEASNSSSAMMRANSPACLWPTPAHPRCLAATANGSHALVAGGPPASSMGSTACGVGDAEVQSEASHWRAQRRVLSIRRRIGASGDALGRPFPPKPPKMRWATYKRLQAVDAALQEQWLRGTAGVFGRFREVKRR